jgi:anti-sigma B factor antagonist
VEFTTQEYKRLVVVTVTGRIDSATSTDFETALQGLMEKGKYNMVLDLAGVDFLSSSGLRVMVSTLKTIRQAGGELCIAQPAEQASEAIAIAGLDALFKSFPTREAAIASF